MAKNIPKMTLHLDGFDDAVLENIKPTYIGEKWRPIVFGYIMCLVVEMSEDQSEVWLERRE